MISKVQSGDVFGIAGRSVTIETEINKRGFPGFTIVGLGNKSVAEAKDRVKSAAENSGLVFPVARIIVNLVPSHLEKSGSQFDLAILLGIMAAVGTVPKKSLDEYVVFGELSLTGTVSPVPGIIPLVDMALSQDFKYIIIPEGNWKSASLFNNNRILRVSTVKQCLAIIAGTESGKQKSAAHDGDGVNRCIVSNQSGPIHDTTPKPQELARIQGQETAKRALQIAAAGNHSILLIGPPGVGKTVLCQTLPHLMPPLTHQEIIDIARIYSSTQKPHTDNGGTITRPFRAPHHTITPQALIGGGQKPIPGEVTLAHNGVLFLDEFGEFPTRSIDMLRQPIESGVVDLVRTNYSVRMPARFLLAIASNPCPCGFYGDSHKQCTCTQAMLDRYRKRFSGPIMDRVALVIVMQRESGYESITTQLNVTPYGVNTKHDAISTPACTQNPELSFAPGAQKLLNTAVKAKNLSHRKFQVIVDVSRTIAHLESSDTIKSRHIAEALQLCIASCFTY